MLLDHTIVTIVKMLAYHAHVGKFKGTTVLQ